MGNLQSRLKPSQYSRMGTSPSSSQTLPLMLPHEDSMSRSSRTCAGDHGAEIEVIRKSYSELAKKVNELARKLQGKHHETDIRKIYDMMANQEREIQSLKEKVDTLGAPHGRRIEQHGHSTATIVDLSSPAETGANQSIPDLISFEPITWEMPSLPQEDAQVLDKLGDDLAAGIIIVVFLLSVLIGLNL